MPSQLKINTSDLQTLIEKANGLPPVLDTSDATAEAKDIVINETAYVNGVKIIGTNPYEKIATDTEVNAQADLLSQIQEALQGKSVPGGSSSIETCNFTASGLEGPVYYFDGTQLIEEWELFYRSGTTTVLKNSFVIFQPGASGVGYRDTDFNLSGNIQLICRDIGSFGSLFVWFVSGDCTVSC